MSKTYLPYDPDQQLLLPPALREWLPDDHLAYFISDVVDQLDLSAITARYEQEVRGGPPRVYVVINSQSVLGRVITSPPSCSR